MSDRTRCALVAVFVTVVFLPGLAHGQLPASSVTGSRIALESEKLSPEQQVQQALQERISVSYVDVSLTHALADLRSQLQLQFVVDVKSFEENAVDQEAPVRLELQGITAAEVLHQLLRPLGLSYVVRDRLLFITTQATADDLMEVRVYPVADLVQVETRDAGTGQRTAVSDFESLIEALENTVDPESWTTVGGRGAIEPYEATSVLVIHQTQRAHQEIESVLASLRASRPHQKPSLPGSVVTTTLPATPHVWEPAAAVTGISESPTIRRATRAAPPERIRLRAQSPANWSISQRHE